MSSVKALAIFRHFKKYRLETGFSMLEAVVVVGVLLALAVGGFISYGPIIDNAKKAKVKSAASEIHTAALMASIDGDSNTKPQDMIDNWNNSTDKIRVEILEPVTSGTSPNDDLCIQATNREDTSIKALSGTCDDVNNGSNPGAGDSDPSATFTAITGGPSASARGIRWINAELALNASVSFRTQDRYIIGDSSEYLEEEAAYDELANLEMGEYASDPYSRLDSGLPELNVDYRSKLATFESDPTLANQQAMVTAYRAVFATALANPIPESDRILVPAPSNPEKFQGVTVAAGSGEPQVVRVALPTSLYDSRWGIGARLDGLDLGASPMGIDGEYTYWDVTISSHAYVTDPDGTIIGTVWNVGTYDAYIGTLDNRGVSRSMQFRITVE